MQSLGIYMFEWQQFLVVGIILLFAAIELFGGLLNRDLRSTDDYLQELSGFLLLSLLIKPGIVLLVGFLAQLIFPAGLGLLTDYSIISVLIVYLLVDDFLQYWYHRSAHEYAFLWKLHRPHHAAREMGLLVSYRNAALYYVLMPNIWWIALVTFLGGGIPVAIGLVLKQLVIVSSHSLTQWDKWLYRYSALRPFAWLVEHVIVTPAFHYAHHGKAKDDEISDPNGNFGNMFSIWDQLFGSAVFTRKYPLDFGLPNDTGDSWQSHTFYPLLHAESPHSEISKAFVKELTISKEPSRLNLKPGNFLWCSCGMSKNQPFCDGHHHGTKYKPKLFKVEKEGVYKLCNCKLSKLNHICDNSHKLL